MRTSIHRRASSWRRRGSWNHLPRRSYLGILAWVLLAGLVTGPSSGSDALALDWTIGRWEGVRRDAASGRETPMMMLVRPILGRTGQTRELEIGSGDDVYRGFAVQVWDAERSVWIRRYTNTGRGWFSLLEGVVESGERSTFRGASPGRKRESRLTSERSGRDGWRRTMAVSEDGGRTWRDLWADELTRSPE